jgi:hypothetical protein
VRSPGSHARGGLPPRRRGRQVRARARAPPPRTCRGIYMNLLLVAVAIVGNSRFRRGVAAEAFGSAAVRLRRETALLATRLLLATGHYSRHRSGVLASHLDLNCRVTGWMSIEFLKNKEMSYEKNHRLRWSSTLPFVMDLSWREERLPRQ